MKKKFKRKENKETDNTLGEKRRNEKDANMDRERKHTRRKRKKD